MFAAAGRTLTIAAEEVAFPSVLARVGMGEGVGLVPCGISNISGQWRGHRATHGRSLAPRPIRDSTWNCQSGRRRAPRAFARGVDLCGQSDLIGAPEPMKIEAVLRAQIGDARLRCPGPITL